VFKRRSEQPSRYDLDATWLGLPMRVVPGTRLLCSGFWGLARHVNYCGEIVQVGP
jgi:delta14-sterol reductase